MAISISGILLDLPDDPLAGLGEAANRLARLNKTFGHEDYRVAVAIIRKFAEKSQISLVKVPPSTLPKDEFLALITFINQKIADRRVKDAESEVESELDKIFSLRSGEPGTAILTPEEKTEIAAKIEFIRQIIERSDLETKKKNVLFKKLNKFAAEVMKTGTDTDTLFAFFGELSLTAGLMAENAKPALDEVKDILRIVFRSRAKREGITLPSPEDILRLPDFSDE